MKTKPWFKTFHYVVRLFESGVLTETKICEDLRKARKAQASAVMRLKGDAVNGTRVTLSRVTEEWI